MAATSAATTRSLWLDTLDPPITLRPSLGGDRDVDVAIVGGGFSGLWTAYYLLKSDPALRVMILEREHCGFGASGRNGGWCVGELAGSFAKYEKLSSASEALRLARAVFAAVDEVGRVVAAEGIDCGYAKGGTIRVARNRPQAQRQRDEIDHERSRGFTEDEMRLLSADEARGYLNATRVESGIYLGPSAALNPAQLVRGLASAVEALGGTIVEGTAVTDIDGHQVRTALGVVRADVVVQATEAYTRDLAGKRRELLPVYSLMIATEPLDTAVFDDVGLAERSTFADDRHMVIYGQRTSDNRIAFGGRGVPYLFGSKINAQTEHHAGSHEMIYETLVDLLPQLAGVAITHRWGGVLAIPRNWTPSVNLDKATGRAVLGGYVGEGVAAANLAGQTLAELIVGADSERVSLPWVGSTSRKWEPEPFRWMGVRGSRTLLGRADRHESSTNKEAKVAYRISNLLRGD